MAVTTKLQAVLTLDNKQFLTGLKASQKAIGDFSRQLAGVNTQLASIGRNLSKLSGVNVKVTQTISSSLNKTSSSAQNLNQSFQDISASSKGITGQQLLLASALNKTFSSGVLSNINSVDKSTGSLLTKLAAYEGLRAGGKNVAGKFSVMTKGAKLIDYQAVANSSEGLLGNMTKVNSAVSKGAASWIKYGGAVTAVGAGIAGVGTAGIKLSETFVTINNAQRAFYKEFNFDAIDKLREATGGMVTDLELMHTAIRAVHLGIDKNQLALYFEFATIRAAETGEEVARLVDQLIVGIGRKSTQRLDDLGLSLVRIQAEVKKTGDFATAVGNIIQEEMGKSTVSVDEVASGAVQLGTAFSNLGTNLVDSGLFGWFDSLARKMAYVVNLGNRLAENKYDIEGLVETADLGLPGKTQAELEGLQRNFQSIVKLYPDYISYLKEVNNEIAIRKGLGNWEFISPEALSPSFIDNLQAALEIYKDLAAAAASPEEYIKWRDAYESLNTYINELGRLAVVTETTTEDKPYDPGGQPHILSFVEEHEKQVKLLTFLRDEVAMTTEEWLDYDAALQKVINDFAAMGVIGPPTMAMAGFTEAIVEANEAAQQLNDTLDSLIEAAFVNLANTLVDIVEGKNIISAFKDFLSQMGRLMATYGALLIAQGVAQEAFTYGDGVTKIIAGAALLALGLAVSAAGASINTAGSGGAGAGAGSYGSGGMGGYDYDREIVLVARGQDLVAVLNRTNNFNYNNGP